MLWETGDLWWVSLVLSIKSRYLDATLRDANSPYHLNYWCIHPSIWSSGTVYQDGKTSSVILASKTRVAIRVQTIELLAAVILNRLIVTLRKSLESLTSLTTYYWTDSTAILHWINNCRPWKQYVNDRVRRYSSPEEWNHCPGVCNPADMPSRGLTGRELKDSKCCPEFLITSVPPLDDCEDAQYELINIRILL